VNDLVVWEPCQRRSPDGGGIQLHDLARGKVGRGGGLDTPAIPRQGENKRSARTLILTGSVGRDNKRKCTVKRRMTWVTTCELERDLQTAARTKENRE